MHQNSSSSSEVSPLEIDPDDNDEPLESSSVNEIIIGSEMGGRCGAWSRYCAGYCAYTIKQHSSWSWAIAVLLSSFLAFALLAMVVLGGDSSSLSTIGALPEASAAANTGGTSVRLDDILRNCTLDHANSTSTLFLYATHFFVSGRR